MSISKILPETEELKKQNYILQATIESYRDVLICSIDRDYRYLVFNRAFARATHMAYGTTVALGNSLLDSVAPAEERLKIKTFCDRAFSGETHVSLESYGSLHRHYYETRYSPILNADGIVDGVTIMASNVTDRKLSEERLLLLNSELENFSYRLTHDLHAPLRSINGYANILLEDFSDSLSEDGKKTVLTIYRNAKKMSHLIDDLLNFSHLGSKELLREQVNMVSLVKNVVEELSIQYAAARKLVCIGTMADVSCDRDLLRLVWLQLLSNALKYSRNKAKPCIEVGCEEHAGDITYYVKDNGVGFDMSYYSKLFGVLQRLHSEQEFEGTGMGLASVQKIIKRHRGRIWAEAVPGEGAAFYFALPKASV